MYIYCYGSCIMAVHLNPSDILFANVCFVLHCRTPTSGTRRHHGPCPRHYSNLMVTLTIRSQLGAASQYVPSPLASQSHNSVSTPPRPLPRRNPHFPTSRPIRPFASISQNTSLSSTKPVKLIEPPQNFKTTFILDLTQGELSRQD
ncbi:hypothetical protein OG21DRAFT_722717 [Imleria badia]|nr:hypothetical protein OG21DRAFT_722717 [Imleria badia]